ncbi:MAG TPA: 2OG-Fe(II) oxygenase [Candidatus Binataceae bacterium]|nr:2OG-Fe(II) oxygenase [Candidatus Binataceae bacterium]
MVSATDASAGRQGGETIAARVARLEWPRILAGLERDGHAEIAALLTRAECGALAAMYDQRDRFRSRIDMARLRFGVGEYKYFAAPPPRLVEELRSELYPHIAPLANEWMREMRLEARFPPSFAEFRERCHRAGQTKPTPLILRYGDGGYNCMHQDLYGEIFFPLQFTFMLSRPGVDFAGGEFLILQQRPRAQSQGEAITLEQGGGVVFATRWRPVKGSRGYYRVGMRHGVSRVRGESRCTLGIIFHDAK